MIYDLGFMIPGGAGRPLSPDVASSYLKPTLALGSLTAVVSHSLSHTAVSRSLIIAVPEAHLTSISRSPMAVQEGHLRLAQRFNVGCGRARGSSPEGTAEEGRDGQRRYTSHARYKPLPGHHPIAKRRKRRAPML
jgi:hypothetical protein